MVRINLYLLAGVRMIYNKLAILQRYKQCPSVNDSRLISEYAYFGGRMQIVRPERPISEGTHPASFGHARASRPIGRRFAAMFSLAI